MQSASVTLIPGVDSRVPGTVSDYPLADAQPLQHHLYTWLPQSLGPDPLRSLIWSILFVGVCFLPVWLLYRRRIFIKL